MIIVSNTSPIVCLAAVSRLDILFRLYGRIIIPTAVYKEIAIDGEGEPGAEELPALVWVERRSIRNTAFVFSLIGSLHEGEAEAIALAVELKADIVLMDDRKARSAASRVGIRCIGLLGILLEAKQSDVIDAVKPLLDTIIVRQGFWITDELYRLVLTTAGEEARG